MLCLTVHFEIASKDASTSSYVTHGIALSLISLFKCPYNGKFQSPVWKPVYYST
jgi:hypothetical protein